MNSISSRHRRTAFSALALAGAAALILSGCSSNASSSASGDTSSSAASGTPVQGGNLVVRIAQDPGSLDSVVSDNVGTTYIGHEIFEQLVTINANYQPKDDLASSYTKSTDGLTYTFKLRPGIVFSNGQTMTAADVVASLNYWVDNNGYASSLKAVLKSVTAPDPSTVVVSLSQPFDLIALMATSNGDQIHQASVIQHAPATGIPKDQIIGTGPYKLKSWTPGQSIVLERNPLYKPPSGPSSGYAGHKHAYLDTITYKFVSDSDAALNGLTSGQWDAMEPTNAQYSQAAHAKGVEIGVEGGGNINYVALNHHPESIMSKAEARDGLNLIIDKKAIIAQQGLPQLISSSFGAFAAKSNKVMFSNAGESKYNAYDPEKGKKMLEAAGFKPGQTLRMITTGEFPQFGDAAVLIQEELKKVGIKSTIGTYDYATLIGKEKNPSDWDVLLLMDDANPPVPDYTDNVNDLDAAGYDRASLAPLLQQFNVAQTPAEQHKAVGDIQAFTSKNLPTITLYDGKSYIAYSDKLGGFDGWGMEFSNVWLKK